MEKATSRTFQTILNGDKIGIFGDYDVDGATSTALLGNYLSELNLNYKIYIPDRKKEGYGPSIKSFKELIDKGVKLIFTVDCGTLSFEAINFAKESNIDVDQSSEKKKSTEELKELQSDSESDDEEDYIIDEEEFTLGESEKEIIIIEKESIPENKVIVNNKEQELDLFNELVRLLPESKRDNKFLLNRISKIMKNCSNLRYNYSYFNENHEPIKPKFKTNNFKPLLNKYINNNFENKTFIPLISCSKDVYLVEGKEDEYIPNIDLITEELDDYSNVIRNDDNKTQSSEEE